MPSARCRARPHRIRTDISATLFLSEPEEYDGGELCVEDTYGVQKVKLPAGHMVLYPATSLHHVAPVTRGARICSFFWIQSMVRRRCPALAALRPGPGHPAAEPRTRQRARAAQIAVQLTGVYHNLLRQWAEL